MEELFPKPAETLIAYTAGLIDGEGSIQWSQGRIRVVISQSINNDGQDLCEWLRDQWQIGYARRQDSSYSENWHWHVDRINAARHVLTLCLPYLRVKRKRAEQALEFLETWTSGNQRGRWTAAEDQIIKDNWREHDIQIAERLNFKRTPNAVLLRRRALGLAKPRGGYGDKPGRFKSPT